MQTSALLFENSSFVLSNPTMTGDEEEHSYDTNIPFFDETQRNSTFSAQSHETLSRQRTRNLSQISHADKQSTQTVKSLGWMTAPQHEDGADHHTVLFFLFRFSSINQSCMLNMHLLVKCSRALVPCRVVFDRQVSVDIVQ
jgi:hypothetical protein